jgi:hypothetical protein
MSAPALARSPFAALAALAALAGSGCSLAVDGFVSGCDTNADCRAKGDAFADAVCRDGACRLAEGVVAQGSDWSCLDRPAPRQDPPAQVRVGFRFVDLMSAQPIAGVSLVTCSNTDVACAQPLGPAQSSGDAGQIEARVSTATAVGTVGFNGYFQADAPERESALFSFHPPLLADTEENVALGRPDQLLQLAPALGLTPNPARTGVVLLARDCRNDRSPNVTFEFEGDDPEVKIFYGVNSIPSAGAAKTDRTGAAFALNVPPGVMSFRMIHPERGAVAQFIVQTRRDYLSLAAVRPDR